MAEEKKWVLSRLLRIEELIWARKSVGSAFQAAEPACEKARSPNFVRSLGVT